MSLGNEVHTFYRLIRSKRSANGFLPWRAAIRYVIKISPKHFLACFLLPVSRQLQNSFHVVTSGLVDVTTSSISQPPERLLMNELRSVPIRATKAPVTHCQPVTSSFMVMQLV